MFQKSIDAVIAQGVKNLEALKQLAQQNATFAQEEVRRCQSEIQALANLAKQVPEKVFDRYSNLLIGTVDKPSQSPSGFYANIQLSDFTTQLRGLMGPDDLKAGRYRVIVLLEPI